MRRVPLFVKAAVVSSSATLLLGFVALKAGLLDDFVYAPTPEAGAVPVAEPTAEFMPGSKYAPIDLRRVDPLANGAGDATSVGPPEIMEQARLDAIRASSSKSSVPLIDPDQMLLIDSEGAPFPPKPAETAANSAPQPMLMPGSKSAPVFVPPTSSNETSGPPRIMMSGSKSMAPLIETSAPAVPKAPPQTVSKGYQGKGS